MMNEEINAEYVFNPIPLEQADPELGSLIQWYSSLPRNVKARMGGLDTIQAVKTPERNDPCPCGSGKKFKKCCLGK